MNVGGMVVSACIKIFVAFHSNELLIFDGYCRWKLLSGNLYAFIRPNQEQKRKMQLGRN